MESLYNVNGLMFWTEREIRLRKRFEEHFAAEMKAILLAENPAWQFIQIEAPLLTPQSLLNPNYTSSDIWLQEDSKEETERDFWAWIKKKSNVESFDTISRVATDEYDALLQVHSRREMVAQPVLDDAVRVWAGLTNKTKLALRPETTPGSYIYAQHLLNNHTGTKPPFVVWQTGKSFRREQEQVTKNMRLKEFYQQEFQCIYTADTLNDYHSKVLEPVRKMLGEMIGLPTRIVTSDRLPSYSEITLDVEVDNGDKWMEVCSISRRTDFPEKARFQAKKKVVEKDLLVLEVAIGLDRVLYCHEKRCENI